MMIVYGKIRWMIATLQEIEGNGSILSYDAGTKCEVACY